jgi:hypothetical protein
VRLRSGIDVELEKQADALLFAERQPSQRPTDGILSWSQQKYRWSHEVYSATQIDPAIRKGLFKRKHNQDQPHLNSCDGHIRPTRLYRSAGWVPDE